MRLIAVHSNPNDIYTSSVTVGGTAGCNLFNHTRQVGAGGIVIMAM
jgi:hypothetical protein